MSHRDGIKAGSGNGCNEGDTLIFGDGNGLRLTGLDSGIHGITPCIGLYFDIFTIFVKVKEADVVFVSSLEVKREDNFVVFHDANDFGIRGNRFGGLISQINMRLTIIQLKGDDLIFCRSIFINYLLPC